MRTCAKCQKQVPDEVAVCHFCGTRRDPKEATDPLAATDTSQRSVSVDEVESTLPYQRARKPDSGDIERTVPRLRAQRPQVALRSTGGPRPEANNSGRWLIAVFALIILLAGLWLYLRPRRLAVETLVAAGATDTRLCEGYQRCLVLYVAPWSNASITTLAQIPRLREQFDGTETGLAFIIGNGEPERMDQLAELIGDDTWLDEGDALLKANDIDTLPSWFALDVRGRIVKRVDGTYKPFAEHLSKLRPRDWR